MINLVTPPFTPVLSAAPEGGFRQENGFVMASSLPLDQGAGARIEVPSIKWNKLHENMLSGTAYRLFIKPLDGDKIQTEGNYTVKYTGKTFLYAYAEPGGGFNITKFKSHLAREGWGAFTPAARDKFTREGTIKPAESFGSVLSTFYSQDYLDFIRFGKPEVIDITQIFNLGDVLWKLYSRGILDHKCENMTNFRLQYQAMTLPGGAKKSLNFSSSSSTTPRTSVGCEVMMEPEGIVISSDEEGEDDKAERHVNKRKDEDRVRAREEMNKLEVNDEDIATETDRRETVLTKNKRLKLKVSKMMSITSKALGAADHFKV